jgi:hypothetical protein
MGIFALGTGSYACLEFDLAAGAQPSDAVARVASLREPRTTIGGVDMRGSAATITIREADTIWREEGGWFDARWHFSFDRYRSPDARGAGQGDGPWRR